MYKTILNAISDMLTNIFSDDLDVMSSEVRKILSHPEDSKKYIQAVEQIRNGASEVTIRLSNEREITLIK